MRLSMIVAVASAALALAAPCIAVAQQTLPGDPVAGHAFARENCSECHHVERDWEELAAFFGPAFVDIAAAPGMTALRLRVFLRSPHYQMPDFVLTEQELDDVISYILTLRPGTE